MSTATPITYDPQRCELAYLRLALRYRERSIEALKAGGDHTGFSRTADSLEAAGRALGELVAASTLSDISTIAASCSKDEGVENDRT